MPVPRAVARAVTGRPEVVSLVRAADPLARTLAAPPTARALWLTAVLNDAAARRPRVRPAAVVVGGDTGGPLRAAAFLSLRRRGLVTVVGLLGQTSGPLPGGVPTARFLTEDDSAAEQLAAGIVELLAGLRGPWSLRLTGLPLGDPTVRALAARLPTAVVANLRSTRVLDALDDVGAVVRSVDHRVLERWLPAFLALAPDGRTRAFLRTVARLHAAAGVLEVAVVADGHRLHAGLLTLLDGERRWPWWGTAPPGGLRAEMGAPTVSLTAPARAWPR